MRMHWSMKKLLALAAGLLLAAVLFAGCGGDGEEAKESEHADSWSTWLTETSVEDPGAWFSVSVLPVE